MAGMRVRYDSDADVVFVVLREPRGGESGGERIDERRYAHFDRADRLFAYEFLSVSKGVSLAGIEPQDATLIRKAIGSIARLAVA